MNDPYKNQFRVIVIRLLLIIITHMCRSSLNKRETQYFTEAQGLVDELTD